MRHRLIVACAFAALALLPGRQAAADEVGRVIAGDQGASGGWHLPTIYRRAIEENRMLRQRPTEDLRQVESKPILDAAGRQLVGIVENRTLTKPQLDLRVNILLQYLPEIKESKAPQDTRTSQDGHTQDVWSPAAKEALDRRVNLEGRILDEWTQATTLAVLAEHQGYKATPDEVNRAMAELSQQNTQDSNHAVQQIHIMGIPEADLRRELEDGIIIEKMMRDQVNSLRDDQLQIVFSKRPDIFLEPTKVKVWDMVALMRNRPTDDDVNAIKKEMNRLYKQFRKCTEAPDYDKMKAELVKNKSLVHLVYINDVTPADRLNPEILNAIFALKPGKTSDLIALPLKGRPTEFHFIKVVDRKDGHKGTFEEAKPRVQNYLTDKLKDVVYEKVVGQYKILTDPSGLREYKEIARIPARPTPLAGAAPAPTPEPTLRRPTLPGTPSLTGKPAGSLLYEPPPVESVVGSKADVPTGNAKLTPAAQAALEAASKGLSPAPAVPALAGAVPATVPAPADASPAAAAALAGAPLPPPVGGTTDLQAGPAAAQATPEPLTPTSRNSRRKAKRPPVNFNAAPPSVEEALGRPKQ